MTLVASEAYATGWHPVFSVDVNVAMPALPVVCEDVPPRIQPPSEQTVGSDQRLQACGLCHRSIGLGRCHRHGQSKCRDHLLPRRSACPRRHGGRRARPCPRLLHRDLLQHEILARLHCHSELCKYSTIWMGHDRKAVVVVVDAAMVVIDLLAARRLSYDCCRHVGRVPSCDLFDAMASTLRSR